MLKKLPVGVDGFEKIRTQDFYYVDKTMFIAQILQEGSEVNLFTRPRRFGKTLMMDMLRSFFEIGGSRTLFDGLKIMEETQLCEEFMGQFPVISLTLKGVDGLDYQTAENMLRYEVGMEASRFHFLAESEKLTEEERGQYLRLIRVGNAGEPVFAMSRDDLAAGLKTLCRLLEKHYDKKVILLIDEYDVPLDKAFQQGYYEEMVFLIRNFLGNALKTNSSLYFAVITGCLRISKESIFTGLNNLNVMSVTEEYFNDSFGFTEDEVKELLAYYGCGEAIDTMRDWYNGYRFGGASVYCPWDVIKYTQALRKNRKALPKNYWANTSGNDLVKRFIYKADYVAKSEIERLINGEAITKIIREELTYKELDSSMDHFWSVLFSTGYLTQRGEAMEEDNGIKLELVIPNREIRGLFIELVKEWFEDTARADLSRIEKFCRAFPAGDAAAVEEMLREYLWDSISIRDTAVRKEMKENFYHGLLLGLLRSRADWLTRSNTEMGEGYSDIVVCTPERTGIVIELKYAEDGKLEKGCQEALAQIEDWKYAAALEGTGVCRVIKYGIAFCRKDCRVAVEE